MKKNEEQGAEEGEGGGAMTERNTNVQPIFESLAAPDRCPSDHRAPTKLFSSI
jgi:hypothetical protein